MSPNFIPETRRPAHHAQRPWRPAPAGARTAGPTVIRAFATPVVRELPPRREQLSAGTW